MAGRLFTSESVTEGHPDKIADQISDTVLDYLMEHDPTREPAVAVETLLTTGLVVVAGEVTHRRLRRRSPSWCARRSSTSATTPPTRASTAPPAACRSPSAPSPPTSPRASTTATRRASATPTTTLDKRGAGDQGLMFGYACDDTPELMPLPIMIAQRLAERLTEVRKDGTLAYLRPDGKTQVTIEYDADDRPVRVDTVVLSTQHAEDVDHATARGRHQEARHRPRARDASTSPPRATGCWSTRPASSSSAARWATPA